MLKQLAASLARQFLKLAPRGTVVRIRRGPLRDKLWTMHSGVHSYWRGTFDPQLAQALLETVKPNMTCFDCGANCGYFTLLFAQLVGAGGRVFAFEPDPDTATQLRRHLELNGCTNVTLIEAALTDRTETASFSSQKSQGRLSAEGDLAVQTYALDELDLPRPDVMKIDVEGAEELLLAGALRMISIHRPKIFLSLHIAIPAAERIASRLASLGYHVEFSKTSYDLTATPL